MRNTVFKTATLTGLFACMLALGGGVFSDITTSAHAIHADEVDTKEELKQFVEEAVDEYYINLVIKQHCDFSKLTINGRPASEIITAALPGFPDVPVEQIRPTIKLFPTLGLTRADIDQACDFNRPFSEAFGRGDGDWKSGSIYLFVMDDTGKMLYNGADSSIEDRVLVAVDEGERDVPGLIVGEADTPSMNGFVEYCWDNPDAPGDEITDSNGDPIPGRAPGDSWKISYVVDPFEYLEASALSDSPGLIFGSGIYPDPGTGNPPSGCDGDGMAGGGDDMDDMDDMDDEIIDDVVSSVSGGGCAIVAGSDNAPRGTMFNLLLIVSALFLAVSFGNRAVGRRNGIRS